jgi:Transposase
MRQSRFTEEQIIAVLKQAEGGMKTAETCRQYNRIPANGRECLNCLSQPRGQPQ